MVFKRMKSLRERKKGKKSDEEEKKEEEESKEEEEKEEEEGENEDESDRPGIYRRWKSLRRSIVKKGGEKGKETEDDEAAPSTSKKGLLEKIGCKRKSKKETPPAHPSSPNKDELSSSDEYVPGKKKGNKVKDYFSRRLGSTRKKKDQPKKTDEMECVPSTSTAPMPQEPDSGSPSEDYIPPGTLEKWKTIVNLTGIEEQRLHQLQDRAHSKKRRNYREKHPEDPTHAERDRNYRQKHPEDATHAKRDKEYRDKHPDTDDEKVQHAKRQKKYIHKNLSSSPRNSDSDNETVRPLRFFPPQFLGEMTNECPFCGALHLPGARICCSNGRIFVPPFPKMPEPLFSYLFDIRHHGRGEFLKDICVYNSLFSFASIQYHRLQVSQFGAQVAKIKGTMRHFTSAALPRNSKYPKFGNYYLYDDQKAAELRFNNSFCDSVKQQTIAEITACMTIHNRFSNMYKTMGDLMKEAESIGKNPEHLRLRIVDTKNMDKKDLRGNHPGIYKTTVDSKDFVSIFYDASVEQDIHYPGLIIYPKRGPHEARPIFPWMKEIDPLCYPLLFPHGESGWKNRMYPVAKDRKQGFHARLEEYATTHPDEAALWDSDHEEHSLYVPSESDSNLDLEESDAEVDENAQKNYYDHQLIQHTMLEDESVPDVVRFVERNGEVYPQLRSDEEVKENSNVRVDVEMVADLDDDSGESCSEKEEEVDRSETHATETECSTSKNSDGNPDSTGCSILEKKHRDFVSFREYGLYINQKRKRFRSRFAAARKLGQFHTIDMDTRIHCNRATMIRKHNTQYLTSQKKTFLEYYQKRCDKKGIMIGAVTSVPASVPGSPRFQQKLFEDTVAMANVDKPDIFDTFTANVHWKEITDNLIPGTTWEDNPFLVNEVFMKKLDAHLDDVIGKKGKDGKRRGGLFGEVKWWTLSIEFQQRGPPHAHIIIALKNPIRTASEVDRVCQAELPVIPDPTDPNYDEMVRLRNLVEKFMIHTPCENNPNAYCQKGKKKHWEECSKRYPKKHNETTQIDDRQYPQLKRRDNGEYCMKKVDGMEVRADNRHVVPHNLELLGKYECHMNIEIISSLRVLKYIFKYLFKGFDRVLVEAITSNPDSRVEPDQMTSDGHMLLPKTLKIPKGVIAERKKEVEDSLRANKVPLRDPSGKPVMVYDEVAMIEDMRVCTANEAAWDLMGQPRHRSSHTVLTVFVHLPDEEPVHTEFGEEAHANTFRKIQEEDVSSRLKAWFELNQSEAFEDQKAKELTFKDLPKFYRYDKGKWHFRKRNDSKHIIGRIKSVSPRNLEQFAVRLLTTHLTGPTSFESLRTVDGEVLPTFADACRQRGLMTSELEWIFALREAAEVQLPRALRRMFITILLFCAVKDPLKLWNMFKADFCERRTDWSDEKKEAHALYHIQSGLRYHGSGLAILGLPEVNMTLLPGPIELCDDSKTDTVDPGECSREEEKCIEKMNSEQLEVFQTIISSVIEDKNESFFLEGTGGCGKTFVYKSLYYSLVAKGHKVLTVAHTGIAATLLPNGSTAHKTFSIPLTTEEGMNCRVQFESATAADLREVTVVLWDEATMSDYRIIIAVHELFCRLHPEKDAFLFGGVTFVFGGDFRQTLPIVTGVRDAAVVNYTIRRSDLWNQLKILHLRYNMRAKKDRRFAAWLKSVGDGSINEDVHMREAFQEFDLPVEWLVDSEKELIHKIYDADTLLDPTKHSRAILCVDNRTALATNEKVLRMVDGEKVELLSIDTYDSERGFAALDPECYAGLTPSGLPPHKLTLKVGAIVILLRNLSVAQSLCNGTRLQVKKISQNVVTCTPIDKKSNTPETVFLHRCDLKTSAAPTRELAFVRRQFPIRLAYALTINKSQGQTFDRVGILLRSPVFTHGQMFVALSRVGKFEDIKVYNSNKENRRRTANVVYRDALV